MGPMVPNLWEQEQQKHKLVIMLVGPLILIPIQSEKSTMPRSFFNNGATQI